MQMCLLDLVEDDDEDGGTAKEWLDLIDRGGLQRINESMFQVMVAMEMELRKHLQHNKPPNFTQEITGHILNSEDVQFHWCNVACDWEENEAEALLHEVVKMWVTIRGFSYASAWVENFKSASTKSLQKSKGVRKKLVAE